MVFVEPVWGFDVSCLESGCFFSDKVGKEAGASRSGPGQRVCVCVYCRSFKDYQCDFLLGAEDSLCCQTHKVPNYFADSFS